MMAFTKEAAPIGTASVAGKKLLLDDLQDLHGAGLDADAAGDALGGGALGLQDHDLHGADLDALAAADTVLLADHVDAGLGVLGDGAVLTDLHALAALDADVGLGVVALCNDLDAGKIFIEFLIKCSGASTDALEACHALSVFLNRQSFHQICPLLYLYAKSLYISQTKIAMIKFIFRQFF